ncbi:restriction endonuclease [Streptomyces sp. NPDC048272]|uniref:restriction endonuclease n=1 Tax=Streptomyces sp. NPDC048272 TaxID=3154616 RepID=UPI00343C2AE1
MHRDGCADAQKVGGRGDNGADVKATDPYSRRWVIQCKHRKAGWAGSAIGTPNLQVLNGTGRQVHGGDVLVMLTSWLQSVEFHGSLRNVVPLLRRSFSTAYMKTGAARSKATGCPRGQRQEAWISLSASMRRSK